MSQVQIVNEALSHLNVKPIASMNEDSKAARFASLHFKPTLEALLRLRKWNFAIKRAALATSTTSPVFGDEYAYDMPTDLLKLIDAEENRCDRKVEGRQIITAASAPLNIRYLANVTDDSLYDPMFRELLGYKLAQRLWKPLSGDGPTLKNILEEVGRIMSEAAQANAWEETPENYLDNDESSPLEARY